VLSSDKKLWIPLEFAYNLLTFLDTAEILYKTTDFSAPEIELCIAWSDTEIWIEWPIHNAPFLSRKDHDGVYLYDADGYD
jgi:dTDP-4-dehydrorhamnose 3,5-epimerase